MSDLDELDRPHEACGVVGIYSRPNANVDVARTLFFALYALQHRGQESAGIATCDGTVSTIHRGMGLVSQIFTEDNLAPLDGHIGLGHNRYSTTGDSHIRNCQPFLIETLHGPLAVGHNGNLTNAGSLRQQLLQRGVGLSSTSDSEVMTQMLASLAPGNDGFDSNGGVRAPDWEQRIVELMKAAEGAYSLVIMTRDAIYAARDPLGLRPLCYGEIPSDGNGPQGWMVGSESPALRTVGAEHMVDIEPGQIVRFDANGVHKFQGVPPNKKSALCVFEYVYFARPDTYLEGQTIHAARQRMGERLAIESPVDADVVIAVPDSSIPAAIGYSQVSGIPFTEGLIKNRYIGRTFIAPSQRLRRDRVKLKYNVIRENLQGKRVIVVDDSIVRGTTIGPLVRLIREGGKAAEVHIRVSSPPIRHPCFMGVDLATHEELIAHRMSVEEIRQHVGADSLAYLSIPGLLEAVRVGVKPQCGSAENGHCSACFSGEYPLDVSEFLDTKLRTKLQFKATVKDAWPNRG